ncbi:hypothetical protein BU24DRAFT_450787 [Aaosphaeria arxii CBS 175.79]|uniref:Uncharacterized protein n=1 Tax=Aaosphaeria arxii CBS 175.79 TaxID=1450172 RepID=A0A6A5XTH8_9PLEO|nr:uncharacterized protein BU24DRAFT_450787 [Aaosphaeria arxii CBS 175.79]KAF2016219.1 hypothetical protein BU24DRAFT_450787 [Aaosphaeria arxii CBS 175.79]
MAKSTTPYNISVTERERRRSGDSSNSELSTLHQFPSISSTSSSDASDYGHSSRSYHHSNAPPVYSTTLESDEIEASRRLEHEQRMRIRDYAMEISRLMGRQLVNGMKGSSSKNSHGAAVDEPKH